MISDASLEHPFDDARYLAEARQRRKSGDAPGAIRLIGDALRQNRLSPEAVETAGRFIVRTWEKSPPPETPMRILALGQCTTSWLSVNLVATGVKHHAVLSVTDGPYDNVLQELMALEAQGDRYDVVVLLPWSTRLLGGESRSTAERIEDEIEFWSQVWHRVKGLGARIVQVGYDLMTPGPAGYHLGIAGEGATNLVRKANECLLDRLPERSYFVDLEAIAGRSGRQTFYSPRRYFWTKQPFSEPGMVSLAEHVWAGIRALTTGPKKVLVLDLDNTIWGGVVGETGPLGIELGDSPEGEAFRAFQQYVKGLASRGVVLAVSSKNNPEDAAEPFSRNPDMVLKLEDFAAFEANWEPKAHALKSIAKTLRLGLDSFVFFDDNPAEREHIRQALPEVAVVDVPEDPSEYVAALSEELWFESGEITAEDQARARHYQLEGVRRNAEAASGSIEDYLKSLDMIADVRDIDEADMPRVVQLIGKTNQFNLTTRRHTDENVRKLLADPRSVGLTLRLQDRFGDYGLVSVLIATPDPEDPETTLMIDTWLMSCRVIGRTVEQCFLSVLLNRAATRKYTRIRGEYIETPKNALVGDLYTQLDFEPLGETSGTHRYQRRLETGIEIPSFVTLRE